MTVHLSGRPVANPPCSEWVQIATKATVVASAGNRPTLAAELERAFDEIAGDWWRLGRELAAEPSAALAHAPACAPNASDFGLMLAWTRLVEQWAASGRDLVVLCPDPWLFRHLARIPGVRSSCRPPLLGRRAGLWVRGMLARSVAALRFAGSALRLRPRAHCGKGGRFLLVYGHPASRPDGFDAYFGELPLQNPALRRILHVDCGVARANNLAAEGRSLSLHGWGLPLYALVRLPFARWRPKAAGPHAWLIRRAAALEGGTAQPAAIAWQIHCQSRWLRICRPELILWPWENHAWERAFVRTARDLGTRLIGYQHSVIGRQMLNYSPASNPDGPASLPDRIFCSGASTCTQLGDWGVPAHRLQVAGALRKVGVPRMTCDPTAPVFVALPFDGTLAREMLAAASEAARHGFRFLIRAHPMFPLAVPESDALAVAAGPLGTQPVSRVVYAASTVGLEALLAGVPTLRFRPAGAIAIDILPPGIEAPVTSAATFAEDLTRVVARPAPDFDQFFGPVSTDFWRRAIENREECPT